MKTCSIASDARLVLNYVLLSDCRSANDKSTKLSKTMPLQFLAFGQLITNRKANKTHALVCNKKEMSDD